MKKTLALVLAILFSVTALAGCGGNVAPPEGKYFITEYSLNGTDFLELAKALSDTFDPEAWYVEFKSDGTYTMAQEEELGNGTFTTDGNKISLEIFGGKAEGTFDSKKITVELEEQGMVLKVVLEKK